MNSISRSTDRTGNTLVMRAILAFALVVALVVPNAIVRAAGAPVQVTGVTVSQNGGNNVVDLRVQGNAQYEWHRLRDPDNRFWLDISGAQLTVPARDDTEPPPLGGIRLRQIDATTVRLAISLTSPKVLEVLSTGDGVRIIVHGEDAGDTIARNGTGTIGANVGVNSTVPANTLEHTSRNVAVSQTAGPTAAQIEAMEHGKSPNSIPVPALTPIPSEMSSNVVTHTAENANATPPPDTQNVATDTSQGPTAAQIAAMTGEPSPSPNPLLTGGATTPPGWKFAPHGAYVATNPRLIVIDPGHGGSDRGASRGGVQEAVLTLDMAKRLRGILTARGWDVMMTRTTDVDVYKPNDTAHEELQARVDVGNTAGARLFVSIHANSFFNSTPYGTTTYYAKESDVPLATDVQTQLANTLGTKDDGIIKSHLYVTLHSNMPAILVESAFLSNPGDLSKLTDPNWRQKLAQAIADGIATYAGAPPKK